jgi:Fe-S cluster assembly iron-binding protein IscA
MLTVTPEAGLAIVRLAAREGAPADGGLRLEALTSDDRYPEFAISLAPLPDEVDYVITEETTGARVVLDPVSAEYVDQHVLDVDDTVEGVGRFRLRPRTNGS